MAIAPTPLTIVTSMIRLPFTDYILDAYTIKQRMETETPYLLLANEMGTGRTKTFLTAILMRSMSLESDDSYVNFRPILCISPVATIVQTAQEC